MWNERLQIKTMSVLFEATTSHSIVFCRLKSQRLWKLHLFCVLEGERVEEAGRGGTSILICPAEGPCETVVKSLSPPGPRVLHCGLRYLFYELREKEFWIATSYYELNKKRFSQYWQFLNPQYFLPRSFLSLR